MTVQTVVDTPIAKTLGLSVIVFPLLAFSYQEEATCERQKAKVKYKERGTSVRLANFFCMVG